MTEEVSAEARMLPMVFEVPEGIVSRYASHIVVQHTDQEFIISFFEVKPPILLGSPEEIRASLERVNEVRAECVARIIVAAGRMQEFGKVLQDNLAKYAETHVGASHAAISSD